MTIIEGRALPGYYFREIELWTRTNCQPYDESWMSMVLSITRISPLVLALVYAGHTYFNPVRELYLFFFGIGVLGEDVINAIINFSRPTNPVIPTCSPVYGSSVAYQVDQAAFVVTFSLCYVTLYKPLWLQTWHIALLAFYFCWNVIGMHFLNYHRPSAILLGAAIGSFNAFVYQIVLYLLIVPLFPRLAQMRWIRWANYQDGLCGRINEPVLYRLFGYDVYANDGND